ncbi:hypothetical protein G4B88_007868 [Cannabis sativa]|uniref:RNase H type-1 domain-containing protein n=1 Tax=Cannabis sativa TaxID=3483 RepID=A0A7J6DTE6_CANSA|nr:hypothetical protein G4B88_007868 [Cannabis sativa]
MGKRLTEERPCLESKKWQLSRTNVGFSTPLFAEAQALLEALRWCSAINLPLNLIESDCSQLVSKVKNNWENNSALSSLVELE